jgi:hypothetical protein
MHAAECSDPASLLFQHDAGAEPANVSIVSPGRGGV